MSVNAASSQTQLYNLLYGQNGTKGAGTAGANAASGTASSGQDATSLLQELLGDAAGTAHPTTSTPPPVSNDRSSSQFAGDTLASLINLQGGGAGVVAGAVSSEVSSTLSELLGGLQSAVAGGGGSTTVAAQPSAATLAGPQGASGGVGGGESISSILATLLAETQSLIGATSSLGSTSLSASSVATASSASTAQSSTASTSPAAGPGTTASLATQALNQLADVLQNLAAKLAASQYANANQLTNPANLGATISSVA
jgi:hypothetical protein